MSALPLPVHELLVLAADHLWQSTVFGAARP